MVVDRDMTVKWIVTLGRSICFVGIYGLGMLRRIFRMDMILDHTCVMEDKTCDQDLLSLSSQMNRGRSPDEPNLEPRVKF